MLIDKHHLLITTASNIAAQCRVKGKALVPAASVPTATI